MQGRIQQIVAGYLALCLALAGAIGISPLLHWAIEHGQEGTVHVHGEARSAGLRPAHRHAHAHGREHGHSHGHEDVLGPLQAAFAVDFLAETAGENSEESHHHNSLPQLLASGLVDQVDGLEPLLIHPDLATFLTPPKTVLLSVPDWDAQSASRAPPLPA